MRGSGGWWGGGGGLCARIFVRACIVVSTAAILRGKLFPRGGGGMSNLEIIVIVIVIIIVLVFRCRCRVGLFLILPILFHHINLPPEK